MSGAMTTKEMSQWERRQEPPPQKKKKKKRKEKKMAAICGSAVNVILFTRNGVWG